MSSATGTTARAHSGQLRGAEAAAAAARIRELRLEHGWPQVLLGRKAGLAQSTVAHAERGRLSNKVAARLAEALGTDAGNLTALRAAEAAP